jgi:hypothetical protein
MSVGNVSAFFRGPYGHDTPIGALVDSHVQRLWHHHAPAGMSTGCLVSDLNVHLSCIVALLPVLAESLAHGPHIEAYVDDRLNRMDEETDFSDFSPLGPLTQNLQSLM